MKTIYILLTKSNTILSRLVHLITADSYTHVAISFEGDLQPLYSSSRKNGRTLFPAGPCAEQLHQGYYRKNAQIPCILYELKVSDESYVKAKKEVQQNHFFCSQFVSEVLSKSNALSLPKDASLMKPSDYMHLPEQLCRFRGQLQHLIQTQPLLTAG